MAKTLFWIDSFLAIANLSAYLMFGTLLNLALVPLMVFGAWLMYYLLAQVGEKVW